jgi:hypothetical protein
LTLSLFCYDKYFDATVANFATLMSFLIITIESLIDSLMAKTNGFSSLDHSNFQKSMNCYLAFIVSKTQSLSIDSTTTTTTTTITTTIVTVANYFPFLNLSIFYLLKNY